MSVTDDWLTAHPATKRKYDAIGNDLRKSMLDACKISDKLDNDLRKTKPDFQTFSQTSQPGGVGNIKTSQTFSLSGSHRGRQVIYGHESLSSVPMHDVEYVVRPDVPTQAVTALVGAKREGKSTYSLSIAAHVSLEHRVLIVQREDPEFIVRARLEAMDADMDNVHIFRKMSPINGQIVSLPFEADDLDGIIEQAEAFGAKLVTVDPVTALAHGDWNAQKAADCLIDLTAFAQRANAAVIAVMHSNQSPRDVSTSATGSDQWLAKCRSHLLIARPPEDPDHAIIQQVSASYSATQNREATFALKDIKGDDGNPFTVSIVTDVVPTDKTVSDIYAQNQAMAAERVDPDQLPEVALFIRDQISKRGNHVFAVDLQGWAKTKDITPNQLRQAYRQASVGQTRQACARPRSILFLTDLCTEEEAKDWGTSERDEKTESL